MKKDNTLNIVVSIVSVVLAVGLCITFYFTKPTPITVAAPEKINTAPVALPAGTVVMRDGLPGGSTAGGGGGAGRGFPGSIPGAPPGAGGAPRRGAGPRGG